MSRARSGAQGNLPAAHYRRQEEPAVADGALPLFRPTYTLPDLPLLSQYTQLGVMTKGTVIEVNVRARDALPTQAYS